VLSTDQLTRLRQDEAPRDEPSVGAIVKIGAFERLTPQPARGNTFNDNDVDLSKPAEVTGEPLYERRFHPDQLHEDGKPYRFGVYAYRVIGINAQGVETGPSPYALTIPGAPQKLSSKEDGEKCHLIWTGNVERNLKGYRVYRMDQRFSSKTHPIIRPVDEEPTPTVRFTDEHAGEHTRRYYIVAVDALGQEGFPSSPTWHRREWQRFYEPFTGERHQ
jgi:hypothetical protein